MNIVSIIDSIMNSGSFDFGTIIFLVIGAMIAGFVDSICGGGGLISIPVLLLSGLTPAQAIAANKLQGAFGALSSTHYYYKKNVLDWLSIKKIIPGAIVGGIVGTSLLNIISSNFLGKILPILLLIMATYFAFSKDVSDISRKAKFGILPLGLIVILPIGAYDGFFGPGAGSFYMMALIMCAGMSLTTSLAYSRVLNLASNITSLIIFISLGKVPWVAGIAMSVGEVIGVYAGSSLAHKRGTKLIKPLLIIACISMAITAYFK